jgi:hypothetical protein
MPGDGCTKGRVQRQTADRNLWIEQLQNEYVFVIQGKLQITVEDKGEKKDENFRGMD